MHQGVKNAWVVLDVNVLSASVGDGVTVTVVPMVICAGGPGLDLELARQLQEEENQRRRREETEQEKEEFKKLQVPQTCSLLLQLCGGRLQEPLPLVLFRFAPVLLKLGES